MDSILVFKGETGPVQVVLATKQRVDLVFMLLETNTEERTVLIKSQDFVVSLGYFNCVYFECATERFLVYSKAACNIWNRLSIRDGFVKVNHSECNVPVTLSASRLCLEVGNKINKCLIEFVQPSETPEINSSEYKFHGKFQPLKSLNELSLWEGKTGKSRVPYKPFKKISERQLLICHDCGSNYKCDIGVNDLPSTYRFFHYLHTDIFVYFSHSRITIPPVAWTESAHRNGTLMLGTFITEGEEGEIENKRVTENVNFYAEMLTKIIEFYGFDGYLINIEAKVQQPNKMIEFLETLTLTAKSVNSNSKIIWYDSMDKRGEIKWKSELNAENLQFLQVSDGFFTDYHWKKGMPQKSAAVAGPDRWKVFTGTDVFGRGTWGGGGFDTKIGVEDSSSTSCAIFAPGWTWEKLSGGQYSTFMQAEKMMWAQRTTPIIDSGGKMHTNRENISKLNALNGWEVFTCRDTHNSKSYIWEKAQKKDSFWEVSDELEFVSSFVKSKREVKVNLRQSCVDKVDFVYGTVEVKGTGPKFNDHYWVELEVMTVDGRFYNRVASGETSEEWKVLKLEVRAENIVEVTWIESGFDREYWQGFYGSRFRNTNVVCMQAGDSLLENFEEKTICEPFCTWFSIGQGPKLWSEGKVLMNSTWNSLQDFDLLPCFLVLSQLEPHFEQVYHGTNSLKVPKGCFELFKCDFEAEGLNVVLVYKGKILLRIEGLSLVKEQINEGWRVEKFALSSHVGKVAIEALEESYLAAVHFFKDFEKFQFMNVEWKAVWNVKSLDGSFEVFDLHGGFGELPEFIRHVNVFVNGRFVGRVYGVEFVVEGILADLERLEFRMVAEDLKGDCADEFVFVVNKESLIENSPFGRC